METLAAVLGSLLLGWLAFVALLWFLRPRSLGLRELVGVVPDVVRLVRDLLADDHVPRGPRLALAGLLLWLISPIDLIPEFVPVLGPLDVTTTELTEAALNALRLAALGLAFAAYALLLDHDRLVSAAGAARRSALAVALATRLVPSLERDAAGLAESVRGRGVRLEGARGYATLLSPLVAGSLERATNLAEAMEARGFGRPGATRAPRPPWSRRDRLALLAAVLLVAVAALWL